MIGIIIPWRSGCPHRERALRWTIDRYQHDLPDAEIRLGACNPYLPFNRAEAILDGARQTSADVLVIVDGDVYCPAAEALVAVAVHGWAIPHVLIHRLSTTSTARLYAGEDWWHLPLSTDNRQDARPYEGHETGTLVVVRRDVLEQAPPDVRFVGWGSEDDAWACALRCLIGPPWRGTHDLVHLWHPPQQRLTRRVGSTASADLLRRYRAVRKDPAGMRALLAEASAHTTI